MANKTYTVSGHITSPDSPFGLAGVVLSGLNVTTNSSGSYSTTVTINSYGGFTINGSGTLTIIPTKDGYTFTPVSTILVASQMSSNQTKNFTGLLNTVTISGYVKDTYGNALSGVTISGLHTLKSLDTWTYDTLPVITNSAGYYTATVGYGYSTTLSPTKSGYAFTPISKILTSVQSNQTVNFTSGSIATYTISGRITQTSNTSAGISGVYLNGLMVSTDLNGYYTASVNSGWSGTVIPVYGNYSFVNPDNGSTSTTYTNVTKNYTTNYTGHDNTISVSGTLTDTDTSQVVPDITYSLKLTTSSIPLTTTTNTSGHYAILLSKGKCGTLTPIAVNRTFTPASYTFSNINGELTQDFASTILKYTISGTIIEDGQPLGSVVLDGLDTTTAANGTYTATVNYGFSDTVTPTLAGHVFTPASVVYNNVIGNKVQDYSSVEKTFTVSGKITKNNVAIPNVYLAGLDVSTDALGNYSIVLPYGWYGTIAPSYTGLTFTLPIVTISSLTSDVVTNFTASDVQYTLSGTILDINSLPIANVYLNGIDVYTNAAGLYTKSYSYNALVPTITPELTGYNFSPTTVSSFNIKSSSVQNYTASDVYYSISGTVYVNDVPKAYATVKLTDALGTVLQTLTTSLTGTYTTTVKHDSYIVITPSITSNIEYTFTPSSFTIAALTENTVQDFNSSITQYTVSGIIIEIDGYFMIPVANVYMYGLDCYTDAAGFYTKSINSNSNIEVIPVLDGWIFAPDYFDATNVKANIVQLFLASVAPPVSTIYPDYPEQEQLFQNHNQKIGSIVNQDILTILPALTNVYDETSFQTALYNPILYITNKVVYNFGDNTDTLLLTTVNDDETSVNISKGSCIIKNVLIDITEGTTNLSIFDTTSYIDENDATTSIDASTYLYTAVYFDKDSSGTDAEIGFIYEDTYNTLDATTQDNFCVLNMIYIDDSTTIDSHVYNQGTYESDWFENGGRQFFPNGPNGDINGGVVTIYGTLNDWTL